MKSKLKKYINTLFLWMGYVPVTKPSNEVIYPHFAVDFKEIRCDFKVNIMQARSHYLGEGEVYRLHTEKAINELMEGVRKFIEVDEVERFEDSNGPSKHVALRVYVGKKKTT